MGQCLSKCPMCPESPGSMLSTLHAPWYTTCLLSQLKLLGNLKIIILALFGVSYHIIACEIPEFPSNSKDPSQADLWRRLSSFCSYWGLTSLLAAALKAALMASKHPIIVGVLIHTFLLPIVLCGGLWQCYTSGSDLNQNKKPKTALKIDWNYVKYIERLLDS